MKPFKIFGFSIQLSRKNDKRTSNEAAPKRRASSTVKKQPKREVSFQIGDIKSAIQQAENAEEPNRKKLHEIYRYVLRDGHLKSQLRTAHIKVITEPWLFYSADGQPDETTTAVFRQRWFSEIIAYVLDSEFHGYSVVELLPGIPASGEMQRLELIDRDYISIERKQVLIEGNINGPVLPYGDVAWEMDLVEFGDQRSLGTLLECSFNIIWKFYSRSDWSRTSEKVGMPILSIEVDSTDDAELDDMEQRASQFGNDGYIVTQKGDTVSLIERRSDRVHDIYKDNIELCNDEISKIINGQTSTSDKKSFVGSAEVHERILEEFTIARLQMISDEINDKLLPYLLYKGFPVAGKKFNYPALLRLMNKRLSSELAQPGQNGSPVNQPPVPQTLS
jgi:phage gp29-like protein